MTPEEAISVNTKLAKELDVPQRARERKAVQLGIEALKKIALLSPKGEKPPIMYEDAIRELKVDNVPSYVPSLMRFQRDADAQWYEKKRIEWTRMDRDWLRIVKGWRTPEYINDLIQQAKEEVREQTVLELAERIRINDISQAIILVGQQGEKGLVFNDWWNTFRSRPIA